MWRRGDTVTVSPSRHRHELLTLPSQVGGHSLFGIEVIGGKSKTTGHTVKILIMHKITAVSMTASNATNQLFKVRSISTYYKLISKCMDRILAKGLTSWP